MKRIPHVYLAAGWFDEAQRKQYDEVYKVLKKFEDNRAIDLFAPQYDGIVLKPSDPDIKKKLNTVYWLDTEMIKRSDLMVALTVNKDVGTIYETGYIQGYAEARGEEDTVKILCYNSVPEHGLNVMLAKPASGFLKNPECLELAIESYLKAYNSNNLEGWYYNLFEGEPI